MTTISALANSSRHFAHPVFLLVVAASSFVACAPNRRVSTLQGELAAARAHADSLESAFATERARNASSETELREMARNGVADYAELSARHIEALNRLNTVTGAVWQSIQFSTNSAAIPSGSAAVIDLYYNTLKASPDIRLGLIGRADWRGSAEFNLKLSERRVDEVYAALVARGIEAWRLERIPTGKSAPRSLLATDAGLAENRSVQAVVLERLVPLHISSLPKESAVWVFREDSDYPKIVAHLNDLSALQSYRVNESNTDVTTLRAQAYWNVMLQLGNKRRFVCGVQLVRDTIRVSVSFADTTRVAPCQVAPTVAR